MKAYTSKEMKRFNYLYSEINAAYHELSLKLGMSDSSMMVLYAICDNGDSCPLLEICRSSGVSKQTVNSALRKLEAEDIVYLEAAGNKNKIVCLTEKGRELAKRTALLVIEMENQIFASWPKGDVEKYLELTERFLADFREKAGKQL